MSQSPSLHQLQEPNPFLRRHLGPDAQEQQAMLDRSRIRPWDADRVRDGLERIVRLRLGLHQAFAVQRAA